MTDAVNGKLLITPMGNMTVQVPYDLQENVKKLAIKENKSTNDFLSEILINQIENFSSSQESKYHLHLLNNEKDIVVEKRENEEETTNKTEIKASYTKENNAIPKNKEELAA